MKHLKMTFKTFMIASILLIFSGIMPISAQNEPTSDLDSIDISLLTCSPHEEIYSLYGHSALRYHDLRTGEDVVFNWGLFNFKAPHFVLRFVFGLTDYELGTTPMPYFCNYYCKWGSSVTEQKLNLTSEEKKIVIQALNNNLLPENRIYRYNFFYDNCSTRPRDIILKSISGKIEYQLREDFFPTYREMVHECVRNHPWAKFGNDILLGVKADQPTTHEQQEFLPGNLMYDFDHAQIYKDGEYRPLVSQRDMLVPPGVQIVDDDFPVSPTFTFLILLVVSVCILILEWRRHKTYKYWDALLMLVQGLTGCILFAMLFSEHPTTSTNLQILLLNPLPLFFIPAVLKRKKTMWWNILLAMVVLFYLGGIFQVYAEGMMLLALCLLIRFLSHYKNA